MQNGLYRIDFATPLGAGAGVVTVSDGIVQGGDSAIAYLGTYSVDGDSLRGAVETTRHTHGLPSLMGVDNARIELAGRVYGDSAALVGTSAAAPGVELNVNLSKIA